MDRRENQRRKYAKDKRYHSGPDNLDQGLDNRYSMRNRHGLYFNMRRAEEFVGMLNRNGVKLEGKKVLDLGSHHGWFSTLFATLKQDAEGVTGADFVEAYNKTARKINPGVEFVQADLFDLPFKSKSYDLIIANYVIVAVASDQDRICKQLAGMLKKGGHILFFDFYDSFIVRFISKVFYGDVQPLYDRKKVLELFEGTDLVEDKTVFNIAHIRLMNMGFSNAFNAVCDNLLPCRYYLALLKKR